MVEGVILDPKTGKPTVDFDWVGDMVAAGRLPKSAWDYLRAAKAHPRGSGPNATKQGFYEILVNDLADGVQILNSTAEALVVPDYQFAANDPHIYPGVIFNARLNGDVSFVVTTPGTITFRVRWGGLAGTVLAQSGAYAPDPTAGVGNAIYRIDIDLVWRTIGSAGSAFCIFEVKMNDYDDASATTLKGDLDKTFGGSAGALVPAVVGSLDTTTAKALSVTAQFSVNTATTQLTNHIRYLACLN